MALKAPTLLPGVGRTQRLASAVRIAPTQPLVGRCCSLAGTVNRVSTPTVTARPQRSHAVRVSAQAAAASSGAAPAPTKPFVWGERAAARVLGLRMNPYALLTQVPT